MPLYHKLGTFPKRHTQFENQMEVYITNSSLTEGFHGHSSLLYHVHRPTQVKEILKSYSVEPKIAIGKTSNHYC
jgi:homogentisate 1,2-dioxygenase